MNRELKSLSTQLNSYFADRRGKYYLCPDGVPRKLIRFGIETDYLTLDMDEETPGKEVLQYRWHVNDAQTHWKRFRTVSLQQAQGKTQMPVLPNSDPFDALVLPANLSEQINYFIDPDNHLPKLCEGLMADFEKVGTTSTYTTQAQTRLQIAGKVIDTAKARAVMASKLIALKGKPTTD